MPTTTDAPPNTSGTEAGKGDYTQIAIDDDGKIIVEFNVWDAALEKHISTVLHLAPEEARLLADMLMHNAEASNPAKKATSVATTG